MEDARHHLIKKLLYLSHHRGMKETDVLMGAFADANLAKMSLTELQGWERLLQENDNHIMDWLLDRKSCPQNSYTGMLERLYEFVKKRGNQS